jgi:SAM-dependent methyltransferase
LGNQLLNNQQNLHAYKGVEDLSTFSSSEAIERYRSERKQAASKIVSFVKKTLRVDKPIKVLDIGSGSSCFLYALEDAGILSYGGGVEISTTRHQFAEHWKQDKKYQAVENFNKDLRAVSFGSNKFDLCTILDSTFTYFYPVDSHFPQQALEKSYEVLKKGGRLVLEMSSFVDVKRLCQELGAFYKWEELPETNKFKYSFYKVTHSSDKDIVCTDSRYIYRDKLDEFSKVEYSKVYSKGELQEMVLKVGFEDINFYASYDAEVFQPERSNRIVLIASKKG